MPAQLRFSPDILRHLGEELVPHLDQSIIELVKNAYDADATECLIDLKNTDMLGGEIVITDNGSGMDEDAIKSRWLLIGKSKKTKSTKTAKHRRIPVGDKGLGRLSALRLGRRVELTTRPQRSAFEYVLQIDWDRFDRAETIESVGLSIEKRRSTRPPGTTIRISKLNVSLSKKEVDSLARNLLLLTGPFEFNNSFRVILSVPQFSELENKVRKSYFNDAVYKLTVDNPSRGKARYTVYDSNGKPIWKETAKADRPTVPFKFELWMYLFDTATFSTRSSTKKEVQNWIQAFGGVYLFEGGMRVLPYGEAGYDWLDMNLRRVRSPEERPSTNNSVGRVSVDNSSGLLVQKTDRVGYVENEAFLNLKGVVIDGLEFMARHRLKLAEEKRQAARKASQNDSAGKQDLAKAIETTVKSAKDQKKLKQVLKSVEDQAKKRESSLREDLTLYRSLATAGMAASVFSHEIGKPLGSISQLLDEIAGYLKKANKEASEAALLLKQSTSKLKKYAELPLYLLKKEKRKVGRIDLGDAVAKAGALFTPLLDEAEISLKTDNKFKRPIYVWGSISLIDGVLANLFSNSINAFQRDFVDVDKRRVYIKMTSTKTSALIEYVDNAGGLKDISLEEMWLPGESTFDNGTGLGLTIVRDSVVDMAGSITAEKKSSFGGVKFYIDLPIQ